MIVDASVVVKWFFAEPGHAAAREVLGGEVVLGAPDLLLVEVANALRRKVVAGEAPASTAHPIIDALRDDDAIRLEPTPRLIPRALDLSLGIRHPLADCIYVALAEERSAPLLTADERLARAVRLGGLDVEVRTLR